MMKGNAVQDAAYKKLDDAIADIRQSQETEHLIVYDDGISIYGEFSYSQLKTIVAAWDEYRQKTGITSSPPSPLRAGTP